MLYDIYDLGEDFKNADPVAALRAGPVLAELRLSRRFTNSNESDVAARFYVPGLKKEILKPLMYARVTAIGASSMMIVGTAYMSASDRPKARTTSHTVGYLASHPGRRCSWIRAKWPKCEKPVR